MGCFVPMIGVEERALEEHRGLKDTDAPQPSPTPAPGGEERNGKSGDAADLGCSAARGGWPWVRRVRDEQDQQRLKAVAATDGHQVVAASHVVEREGEIVGYASLGRIHLLNVWVHSRAVRARESLALLNLAENLAAEMGQELICVPCAKSSPFYEYMERFGYRNLGQAGFNLKQVGAADQ